MHLSGSDRARGSSRALHPLFVTCPSCRSFFFELARRAGARIARFVRPSAPVRRWDKSDVRAALESAESEVLSQFWTGALLVPEGASLRPSGLRLRSPGALLKRAGILLQSSGAVPKAKGVLLACAGPVLSSTGGLLRVSVELLTSSGTVLMHSGELLPHSGTFLPSPGRLLTWPGALLRRAGALLHWLPRAWRQRQWQYRPMHRGWKMPGVLVSLLAVLVVACGSSSGGGNGFPTCSSSQACTQTSHGQTCIDGCGDAGVSTCPIGTMCTVASGCCSGTGCSAVAVHVCCPSSGC